jgi:hypothetical protein
VRASFTRYAVVAMDEVSTGTAVRAVRASLRIHTVVAPRQTFRVLAERAVDAAFATDALDASFVLGSGLGGLEQLT